MPYKMYKIAYDISVMQLASVKSCKLVRLHGYNNITINYYSHDKIISTFNKNPLYLYKS